MVQILVEFKTKKKRRGHILKMWSFGLKSCGNYAYAGRVSTAKYNKIVDYCIRYKISYRIDNDFGTRSTDYRANFFKANKPLIGNLYMCVYCGRLVAKKNITVDHLYPVGCANRSLKLQRKLKRLGYKSVNDVRNLVPACRYCNQRKSAKMGLWIVRGKLGKITSLWIVRHAVRITIAVYLIQYFVANYHV